MKRVDFFNLLEANPSILLIFFTGKSCTFCSKIKPYIEEKMKTVEYPMIILDREEDTDVFSAMQTRKQIKGVPTILAYKTGNMTMISDLSISGTNTKEIDAFFDKLDFL